MGDGAPTPARIQMIGEILASMGVTDYDPKVSHVLFEFLHRYCAEVCQDATSFQEHANKPELDVDDIRLAIQSKVNGMFSQPPPREFMIEIGRAKNQVPLPIIRPGVHLPLPQHCNAGANYQIVAGRDHDGAAGVGLTSPRAGATGAGPKSSGNKGEAMVLD
mmetsp:Transcript_41914/g.102785  ORF Transcript_41914/g.102785 Transcript_41914/m.102785 type:complete len:162 (+) Transcript_41914:183-668(+)